MNEDSVVYSIPCNGCDKVYIGETGRGINKRLYEHKGDVRRHNCSNSLVVHIDQHQHLPKWHDAKVVHKGLNKQMKNAQEAVYIRCDEVTKRALVRAANAPS